MLPGRPRSEAPTILPGLISQQKSLTPDAMSGSCMLQGVVGAHSTTPKSGMVGRAVVGASGALEVQLLRQSKCTSYASGVERRSVENAEKTPSIVP